MKIAVIGGGAAGYFCAIRAAELLPSAEVSIFEAGSRPLAKVEISGGGRCNVTHGCFEIARFLEHYPRGAKELRGPFNQFQAADTVEWFESRGVKLKREEDGRMFPCSDSSQTIIDCLEMQAQKLGVRLKTKSKISAVSQIGSRFGLQFGSTERLLEVDRVVLTPGGGRGGHKIAASLGHTIVPAVPSLFTFNINDSRLENLAGVSTECAELKLKCAGKDFEAKGPLMITHWGLSGPAVLKLSAWAARELFENDYQAQLRINWLAQGEGALWQRLLELREANPRKKPRTTNLGGVTKRLWSELLNACDVSEQMTWAELGNKMLKKIHAEIVDGCYTVSGKGVFKEEFVTCGGVELSEVDFKTMQSKITSGLFLAGEILNVDGLTGGFNFQSAWTTGFLAGSGVVK